ncbi:MAG: type IV conjugative transfer system protein TraL [Gallionella sp.]|nr:type IV conjugative transfer system protein TraL [Gallionella sp.]
MNQGYIPQTLDKPEQFLFFDVDQFIIATSIVGVGISIGSMVGGLIAGVVTARQYGKLKSGKHPKFAVHLLYWWLPNQFLSKTEATPPSHIRYFLG